MTREEATAAIERLGGKVSGTVSQVNRPGGQKSTKARPTTASMGMVDRVMSPELT